MTDLPFGNLGVDADAEGQRALHPLDGEVRLHQRAERNGAGEVGRAHHQDGEHRRDMSVAGDEAGQPRLSQHQRGPVVNQHREPSRQFCALDRLAGHERHRFCIVGHPRDGEAEIGLVALLVEVEPDQRPADAMGDQRADPGIGERGPDQIAREGEIHPEQRHRRAGRETPEDVGEGKQRNEAVEQPGPELVRALDEQQHVVGDAQMDVVDRTVDEADAIMASLRHPDRHVSLGHPAAPTDQQVLAEEILRHAGRDCARRDEAEHDKLGLECVPVARLQRIEEAGVPMNDRDGNEDVAKLAAYDPGQQRAPPPAILRMEIWQSERDKGAQPENDPAHHFPPAPKLLLWYIKTLVMVHYRQGIRRCISPACPPYGLHSAGTVGR